MDNDACIKMKEALDRLEKAKIGVYDALANLLKEYDLTPDDIANYGLLKEPVENHAEEDNSNIKTKKGEICGMLDSNIDDIIKLYQIYSGMYIARKYNVNYNTLYGFLRRRGIKKVYDKDKRDYIVITEDIDNNMKDDLSLARKFSNFDFE